MNYCRRCVLSETIPGVRIDDRGLCQYCRRYQSTASDRAEKTRRFSKKLHEVIKEAQCCGDYDVIMAYSGGKDSSYTLVRLKRDLGLRALAVTFNHGFLSAQCLENIHRMTDSSDIDHYMVTPSNKKLCSAFRASLTQDLYSTKALQRASAICHTCMNLVKSVVLKLAVEKGVPLIAYGWSPAQAPIESSVMRVNGPMIGRAYRKMKENLLQIMGEDAVPFLLKDDQVQRLEKVDKGSEGGFLHYIYPLFVWSYDEGEILDELDKSGWIPPRDTGVNSSNCVLDGFANWMHQKRHGYHPYTFEVAGLVRMGLISRHEGFTRLNVPADSDTLQLVAQRLGVECH
jgi:hypothetical protein